MEKKGCLYIAACTTLFAVLTAIWHIYQHLNNYLEPTYQRYTVRIILMVPIYAITSFLSLVYSTRSIYFNSIRDIYEAWVIYNFLSLCLAWVGGPGAVITSLGGRMLKPSWHLMTCCLPPLPLDGRFIRGCKRGCLQFVILKPILTCVTLIQYFSGQHQDNVTSDDTYIYTTGLYTISYTLALGALILFYVACKDLLKPFNPLPKFVIIKSVVFLTYWQSVLVSILANIGLIRNAQDAIDIQNFLICVEMALAALGHLCAFPSNQYSETDHEPLGGVSSNIAHALNIKDVVYDTMHQFAPSYQNYVLYSDGTQEAPQIKKEGLQMESMCNTTENYVADKDKASTSENLNFASPQATEHTSTNITSQKNIFLPYDGPGSKFYKISPLHKLKNANMKLHTNYLVPTGGTKNLSTGSTSQQTLYLEHNENNRSSIGEEASETTRLTSERRRSSHGVLLDEIDITGEQDEYVEGYIQR